MHRLIIALLRLGLAGAVLVGLYGQIIVIPTTAYDMVQRFRPWAPYAVPYATVAILGVACVQVALVAVWMLLGLIRRDLIFTPRVFRWIDTIIAAAGVATLLAFGVAGHLAVGDIPAPGDGMQMIGAMGGAGAGACAGVAFIMLMAVIRGLFRKATDLQTLAAA